MFPKVLTNNADSLGFYFFQEASKLYSNAKFDEIKAL